MVANSINTATVIGNWCCLKPNGTFAIYLLKAY